MKATGIVRRIDDLGRIVIPKEIRRTMRIREGDPLEIFTDRDGEVIFKKYSPIGEIGTFAGEYCEVLSKVAGGGMVIADRDMIIAVSGAPKKELQEHRLSHRMEELMEGRTFFRSDGQDKVALLDNSDAYSMAAAMPIVANGDVIGCVAMVSTQEKQQADETDCKLLQAVAGMLSKHMES